VPPNPTGAAAKSEKKVENLMSTVETKEDELLRRHHAAEAEPTTYRYSKPSDVNTAKGFINLGRRDMVRGAVQVVKKHGGENNLHYHTTSASFWMVLKGRVRFYGPDDVVIGEFGPHEGTITPRFARYWFESVGEEDLELLQVSAFAEGAKTSGRTDVSVQRFNIGSAQRFSNVTSQAADLP
jgi:mannose-6-phosphate isomerase-like protein (cupin superfamily)